MFDAAFASIATAFSAKYGGPYYDAVAFYPGVPAYDDGGSIVTPALPTQAGCSAQVDRATEAMRSSGEFIATDVRLLVLGLTALDPTAKVTILVGPHSGTWRLISTARDPASIGYECHARRV